MEQAKDLADKIAVVTGASRGIGKGIATVLGMAGATVYVTGRTKEAGRNPLPGTIYETADSITALGGTGIAVACDHTDDDQVMALYASIKSEHDHIDILVNNAAGFHADLLKPPPFWTKSVLLADQITSGLRSAYTSTYYAAPLLLESEKALVVNISYYGSVSYFLDPAYGATKAGIDKMTWDMAQDFKPYGVSVISVWPGPTRTERVVAVLSQMPDIGEEMRKSETQQFTGLVVKALYQDPNLFAKSGLTLIGAEAAIEYGFTDKDGHQPPTLREKRGSPHIY